MATVQHHHKEINIISSIILVLTLIISKDIVTTLLAGGGSFLFLEVIDFIYVTLREHKLNELKAEFTGKPLSAASIMKAEKEKGRYNNNPDIGPLMKRFEKEHQLLKTNVTTFNMSLLADRLRRVSSELKDKFYQLADRYLFFEEQYGNRARPQMKQVGNKMMDLILQIEKINDRFLKLYDQSNQKMLTTDSTDQELITTLDTVEASLDLEQFLNS